MRPRHSWQAPCREEGRRGAIPHQARPHQHQSAHPLAAAAALPYPLGKQQGGTAMHRKLIAAGALVALGIALGGAMGIAVATASPDFVLRGGRFRPLSYAELN